jgi:hypothetical protein
MTRRRTSSSADLGDDLRFPRRNILERTNRTTKRPTPRSARRHLLKGVIAVLAAVNVLVLVPTTAAHADDENGCNVNVQYPHYSEFHGGIDVSAVWNCTEYEFAATIHQSLFLWLCAEEPPQDEPWIEANCTLAGRNIDDGQGPYVVRTAPHPGEAAAHGDGWWISCTSWYSTGVMGDGTRQMNFSAPQYLVG